MLDSRRRDALLAVLAGLAAVAVMTDQIGIVLTQILPANGTNPAWRFGAVGLTVGRATPMVLADLLLLYALLQSSSPFLVRAAAAMHVGVALLLGVILVAFALDAAQLAGGAPESGRRSMVVAAVRAGMMLALLSAFTAWVGTLLWRAARHLRQVPRVAPTAADVLVVGGRGERRHE